MLWTLYRCSLFSGKNLYESYLFLDKELNKLDRMRETLKTIGKELKLKYKEIYNEDIYKD